MIQILHGDFEASARPTEDPHEERPRMPPKDPARSGRSTPADRPISAVLTDLEVRGLFEDRPVVHANDLHATILKLLGLDHLELTYLFEGREQRLTDVGGHPEFADRVMA